ncbi:MAG: hypothetical protein R2867_45960 [Caldilineaceae bacterium]
MLTATVAAVTTGALSLWLCFDFAAPQQAVLPFSQPLTSLRRLCGWAFALNYNPMGVAILVNPGSVALISTGDICEPRAWLCSFYVSLDTVTRGLILFYGWTFGAAVIDAAGAIAFGSCIGVFVLQAGHLADPTGPLRMLVPPVLAFPLFLTAQWYIDQIPLNPQNNQPATTAALLLTLGLLLLFAPVPLHSAQPATAQSAPPIVSALVMLLISWRYCTCSFAWSICIRLLPRRKILNFGSPGRG